MCQGLAECFYTLKNGNAIKVFKRCGKDGLTSKSLSDSWQFAGFHSLRVQSLDKVKKALILVEEELRDSEIFLDFFEFAFKFCLTVSLPTLDPRIPWCL